MGVRDEKSFIKPLELDPYFRESKALVLDAARALFDRSVVKFFPPEHGGDAYSNLWLTVNGFKESMSEKIGIVTVAGSILGGSLVPYSYSTESLLRS